MARNTSISGSNNFRWNIGDSNTAVYVDKPILREFWDDVDRCSEQYVTFFELLDLGSFQNFGFINFDSTSLGIKSFIKLISDQLVYLDKKLKGENPSLPTLTIEETNNTGGNSGNNTGGNNTNIDTSKYYWYIGVDNPASITNIQSSNNVPGWHKIGSSLSGFVLDTNNEANEVILNTNPVYYNYYVVIPNGLGIYDFFGFNLISDGSFNEVSCNISGYNAYQYVYGQARTACGIIIK